VRVRLRRPSPAMVVACLALVLAMGGTTWAVTSLPVDSVGSAQLRTGAVSNAKLGSRSVTSAKLRARSVTPTKVGIDAVDGGKVRNGSLTGTDLKNNTLTGKQVAESKLGIVPSAAKAGATTGVMVLSTKHLAEASDQESAAMTELGKRGRFTFYAKCFKTGSSTTARLYVALPTLALAVFGTDGGDSSPTDGYLSSDTPEDMREIQSATAAPNSIAATTAPAVFRATDGLTTISGVLGGAFAKNGTVNPGGNGPFGAGNSCFVGGGAVFG
jgi:hypothetical protein